MTSIDGAPRDLRFDGRAVVVTGAGRGMGREHALLMARRGAKIVVSDLGVDLYGRGSDQSHAQEVVSVIESEGGEAIACHEDLATGDGAKRTIALAMDTFGRIDALVHNAGFTLGSKPFGDEEESRLERLLSINTRAAFVLAREAWPQMVRQGHGRIVLVASTALYGLPGSLPYSMAKSSYIGMTCGLAAEGNALGIKVNLVSPAGATRMADNMADGELKQWVMNTARVDLVSPLVGLLSHERCPVNGELFVAGGGRIARTVIGETAGWVNPDMAMEDVLANMPAIVDEAATAYPRTAGESLKVLMDRLGFKPSAPFDANAGGVRASDAGSAT